MNIQIKLLSPLEKVFLDEEPRGSYEKASVFRNEHASFQLALCLHGSNWPVFASFRVTGCDDIHVREVYSVPVRYAVQGGADDNYLRTAPGLYPDALKECRGSSLTLLPGTWHSLWIDAGSSVSGEHVIKIEISPDPESEISPVSASFHLTVLPAVLPEQKLVHTKWFHCDCLCQYYHVEMWSERFWEICESYVRAMAKRGINMLLTPVHTPPLDTEVGGERLTCQLTDITAEESGYRFGFFRLRRWVEMAERCGIRYFEIAHLFTQWGAKHAPKIMANVNGAEKRIFGWDTDADGPEYAAFLREYLPALRKELQSLGVLERCYFHLSDEPSEEMLESYRTAKAAVSEELSGLPVIDATSEVNYYRLGLMERPVAAVDAIEPFLQEGVPHLWAYYCISQYRDVPNTFVSMPGHRTRILGMLLYKYRIEGFLHWGYNFYHSQYSRYAVDPWSCTDCDGFTPAGDAFQVYPGGNGQPVESQRMMLADEAMHDLRALELLEGLIGREKTLALLENGIEPLTFSRYPHSNEWLLETREKVNRAIEEAAQHSCF